MGRRSAGTVSMQVEAEVDVAEVISNIGATEAVEAAVEEDRDAAYEGIDVEDFNEWCRDNGYAPGIDAAMLIDDRTSPVTALVEVANEVIKRGGADAIATFVNNDRLDGDVRTELVSSLWPTPEEIANRDDQWEHYLARIVSEFVHLYGYTKVLAALREQNALQPGFRAVMEKTAPPPCDCGDDNCGVTPKPKQSVVEFSIDFDAHAAENDGPTFVEGVLADDELRERFVRVLRPEIEKDVKKGILRRITEFVFGEVL